MAIKVGDYVRVTVHKVRSNLSLENYYKVKETNVRGVPKMFHIGDQQWCYYNKELVKVVKTKLTQRLRSFND